MEPIEQDPEIEHLMPKLTEVQIINLKMLASYLESGQLQADFEMSFYAEKLNHNTTDCGSVGCAIGHGPYAGIRKPLKWDWSEYADEVFGAHEEVQFIGNNQAGVYHLSITVFQWCFESDWSRVDNSPGGAARRIRYMLEHGIPENYYSIIDQTDEIPY